MHKWLANAGLVKARIHNNPQKAQPKKKAQERAAAAAKAAEACVRTCRAFFWPPSSGAVGLKGEVRAKLFTATPDALPRYKSLHTAAGRKLVITAFRPAKEGEAVIVFEGVRDREGAEALKGAELYVDRAMLPATGEDEFYHADLIGLEARAEAGGQGPPLGTGSAPATCHN